MLTVINRKHKAYNTQYVYTEYTECMLCMLLLIDCMKDEIECRDMLLIDQCPFSCLSCSLLIFHVAASSFAGHSFMNQTTVSSVVLLCVLFCTVYADMIDGII